MQIISYDSSTRLKDRPSHFFWRSTLLESGPELDAPPSYLDSTRDTPPPYAEVDLKKLLGDFESIITASFTRSTAKSPPRPEPLVRYHEDPIQSMTTPSIDFDDTSNFRQAAKKGKGGGGKAQKQANKNSWGSGDEGNKDAGGGDGDGAAGDGGGNAAGGAGGDGGDGGDEWNDWSAPGKKKKGKKGKGGVDEEEEKKRKEEEEEKEKEQEDAAKANPLSWADSGNPSQDDEWGGFTSTTKKGKKGKKDKVFHSFLAQSFVADILP